MAAEEVRDHFGTLPSFDASNEVEFLVHGRVKIDRAAVAELTVAKDAPFIQGTFWRKSGFLVPLGFWWFDGWLRFRRWRCFPLRRPVQEQRPQPQPRSSGAHR